MFVVGLVLFFFLTKKIGFGLIMENLHELGWVRFIFLVVLALGWYLCYSLAWQHILQRPEKLGRGFVLKHLLSAKLAGEAVNYLTPVGSIGGEPARVFMIRKMVPVSDAVASVVVDKTLHFFSTLVVVVLGVLMAIVALPLTYKTTWTLIISVCFLVGLAVFAFVKQQYSAVSSFPKLLHRLGIKWKWLEERIPKLEAIDQSIKMSYRKSPRDVFFSLLYHFAGRILGILEIYFILNFIGVPVSLLTSFFLGTLTILMNFAFFFVPSGIGLIEGGQVLVFHLLGLQASTGLSLQVIRRIRQLLYVVIGLALMAKGGVDISHLEEVAEKEIEEERIAVAQPIDYHIIPPDVDN